WNACYGKRRTRRKRPAGSAWGSARCIGRSPSWAFRYNRVGFAPLHMLRSDDQSRTMPLRVIEGPLELKTLVGQQVGISDWFTVTQERINAFAEVTGDRQWI